MGFVLVWNWHDPAWFLTSQGLFALSLSLSYFVTSSIVLEAIEDQMPTISLSTKEIDIVTLVAALSKLKPSFSLAAKVLSFYTEKSKHILIAYSTAWKKPFFVHGLSRYEKRSRQLENFLVRETGAHKSGPSQESMVF